MSTLQLTNQDLTIVDNGLVILSSPLLETAQRLGTKFRFFLGEWFLNTAAGVDYLGKVLVKNPNLTTVSSIFRKIIATDEGIDATKPITVLPSLNGRTLMISYNAVTISGEVLNVQDLVLGPNQGAAGAGV